jgi:hypothetical protein
MHILRFVIVISERPKMVIVDQMGIGVIGEILKLNHVDFVEFLLFNKRIYSPDKSGGLIDR